MEKQAIETSIKELKKIINDRKIELKEQKISSSDIDNIKIVVNIVNMEGLSDTWKFEN